MDIKERIYIGYGTSLKSEKDAFEKGLEMAKEMSINVGQFGLTNITVLKLMSNFAKNILAK